jgi:cytochrome c553
MKYYLFLISIFLFLTSCKDSPKTAIQTVDKTSGIELLADQSHPGKGLLEKECYTCHNPRTAQSEMIAPPMIAVKKHYLIKTTTRDQFVKDIMHWVKDPSEKNSRMPGALRKFGIMPYQSFPEETVLQIAEYLYDNDIDKPDWFQSHKGKGQGKGKGMGKRKGIGECSGNCMGKGKGQCKHMGKVSIDTLEKYKKLGQKYASRTKAALGKRLMEAITEKGPDGAVEFCNINALPLTDSLSLAQGAKIRRVTDKPRNPLNKANEKELTFIADFKKTLTSDYPVEPILDTTEGQIDFYYPITTNAMCLQCHGVPEEQIATSTLSLLDKLYPNDRARNYQENEVRGIWAIRFNQK